MMAMSFKPDVDAAMSIPRATAAEDDPEVSNSVFRRRSSGGGARRGSASLHSGLSALIQAATTQLGHLSDDMGDGDVYNDENTSTIPTGGGRSRSRSGSPRHYTPHGFCTSSMTTSSKQFSLDQSNKGSFNTTPTLGPEATASELRKQTFPEVLMTILEDKANGNVITFLPDGKFFAVRRKEFAETTMLSYFSVSSFEDFLKKIHSWGFSRIDRGSSSSNGTYRHPGIEIFRHPMFVKGDWERCSRICFGESPTEVRLSALPTRARIEYTLSDESTLTASKRRLSPSHLRQESEISTATSKQRLCMDSDTDASPSAMSPPIQAACNTPEIRTVSKSESTDTQSSADASTAYHLARGFQGEANTKLEDDVRSLALAITTEKLNLKTAIDDHVDASTPLIERAVENCTHTIVTDAIETLLRDEGHTRETYLKHERELSRSSLPGVVPISKQLFSPPVDAAAVTAAAVAAAEAAGLSCGVTASGDTVGGARDPPAGASVAAATASTEGKTTGRRCSIDPPRPVLAPFDGVGIAFSANTST